MKRGQLSKEERIVFSEQLVLTINSAIPITEGLLVIKEKADQVILKECLERVIEKVYTGISFGEALAEEEAVFSSFYCQMIKIGEESGNLPLILERLIKNYRRELETTRKLRQALTYPLILSGLMLIVIVILVVQVMPMFQRVINSLGGEVPQITKIIMSVSFFLRDKGIYILCVLLFLFGLTKLIQRTKWGNYYFQKRSLTGMLMGKVNSGVLASRFAANLSLLLNSGINVTRSLKLIRPIFDNQVFKERLDKAIVKVEAGEDLDQVTEELDIFPPLLVKLFSIGLRTGQLDKALSIAADQMDKEVENRLNYLTTIIEPFIIIILSIIVGILLISVVIPVIDIMNSIG